MSTQAPQQQPEARPPKRIAWDGVSFVAPPNWELAIYKFPRKGVTRIELDDEYTMRMEAEWIRPRRKLRIPDILKRYERASRKLTARAHHKKALSKLPQGWIATQYQLRETVPNRRGQEGLSVVEHGLITAFYLCPMSSVFCFVLLHFMPEDPEDPVETIQLIASELKHHTEGALVPWQLFDISFELPRDFVLERTDFDIGCKRMLFRWKRRRFHLWYFSCADMFLKDDVIMEEWVAGYLNGYADIPAASFAPGTDGEITWKRRRRHWICHRDELVRGCFRYVGRCHCDRERNMLAAWVFHYCGRDDLRVIPDSLRFGKPL